MVINNLTPLIDMVGPLSLVGLGWLSYLQAHSCSGRRASMECSLVAIGFPGIALFNPGVFPSFMISIIGGIGIWALRWEEKEIAKGILDRLLELRAGFAKTRRVK